MHLGLVRGVLAEHGADPAGSRLLPFAGAGRLPARRTAPMTRCAGQRDHVGDVTPGH